MKFDTLKKIEEAYYADEEYFNAAAEVIMKHGSNSSISITPDQELLNSEVYSVTEINGLFMVSSPALSDPEYREIYDALLPLMEKYNLCGVTLHDSQIVFTLEGPVYGKTAILEFFGETDLAVKYETLPKDYFMINPHWYAEFYYT